MLAHTLINGFQFLCVLWDCCVSHQRTLCRHLSAPLCVVWPCAESPGAELMAEVLLAQVLEWTIGKIPSDKTPLIQGNVSFPPDREETEENVVVTAEFKLQGQSVSGIGVDSLSLTNEKYKPYKVCCMLCVVWCTQGVRCVCAGSSECYQSREVPNPNMICLNLRTKFYF